jgi:hypothetical protein
MECMAESYNSLLPPQFKNVVRRDQRVFSNVSEDTKASTCYPSEDMTTISVRDRTISIGCMSDLESPKKKNYSGQSSFHLKSSSPFDVVSNPNTPPSLIDVLEPNKSISVEGEKVRCALKGIKEEVNAFENDSFFNENEVGSIAENLEKTE